MAAGANHYDGAKLTVLEFDAAVRKRPAMYFGCTRQDPALATAVLRAVLIEATHPPATLAPVHAARVSVEITGDLAFTVTDDLVDSLVPSGYLGSLLTPARWGHAAAAALCARVSVEVWRDGRGVRQEHSGLRLVAAPVAFAAAPGAGTRVAYDLDPDHLAAGAAVTADLASLDPCGVGCVEPGGPGDVVVRDLRPPTARAWRPAGAPTTGR
jgi:hypothetical protein